MTSCAWRGKLALKKNGLLIQDRQKGLNALPLLSPPLNVRRVRKCVRMRRNPMGKTWLTESEQGDKHER